MRDNGMYLKCDRCGYGDTVYGVRSHRGFRCVDSRLLCGRCHDELKKLLKKFFEEKEVENGTDMDV